MIKKYHLIKRTVDIKENTIRSLDPLLLQILLIDQSRKKASNWKWRKKWSENNIIWATDNYESKWFWYHFNDWINSTFITGFNGNVIKPRIKKSLTEQKKRSREKAEVFTPAWICNKQNNAIDNVRFWKEWVFNKEISWNRWIVSKEKINFSDKKWYSRKDYVSLLKLEITCWEAPYMVSRYDVTSGDMVKVNERIGILDRKIRVINENAESDEEWLSQVEIAFKSSYWYEWQWDSLLIARENLLWSFIDYYYERFHENPEIKLLKHYAHIISWNVRQMDWLTWNTPIQPNWKESITVECYIKDWKINKPILFKSLKYTKNGWKIR